MERRSAPFAVKVPWPRSACRTQRTYWKQLIVRQRPAVSRTHLIQFSGTPAERTALDVVLFHITIDRRCRAALRRHSGKGRAVPERACRFVSYLVESGKHLTS
jgi:hypothetical protein